jgi:hypothetical protein
MAWDIGVCGSIGLFGHQVEAEGLSGGAYAMIERQQCKARNHGTRKQSRSQVNRIQGPNRLARKRTACSLDNLNVKPQDIPVGCCPVESSPATPDPLSDSLGHWVISSLRSVPLERIILVWEPMYAYQPFIRRREPMILALAALAVSRTAQSAQLRSSSWRSRSSSWRSRSSSWRSRSSS